MNEQTNEQANEQTTAPKYHDGLFRDHWDSFKSNVIPSEAGRFQRSSMCQAFIGGALAYRVAMTAAFGAEDTPEEDAIKRLNAIDASVDGMAHEFMSGVDALVEAGIATETPLENGARSIEPAESERVVHVQAIEAPNLTPDDLDALSLVIKAFVNARVAARAELDAASDQSNE